MKKLSVSSLISVNLILVLVVCSTLPMTGCSSTQIQDTLDVAAQVATSAGAIVSAVSPEYGALLTAVGARVKDVSGLFAAYEAAPAKDKAGALAKLHTGLDIVTANLDTILKDSGIKAPGLVTEIKVAVAIVNSAVSLILAHLPVPKTVPGVNAQARAVSLPVVANAKSAKDLATEWNNKVGANYPGAVVSAPQHHKMLGIF